MTASRFRDGFSEFGPSSNTILMPFVAFPSGISPWTAFNPANNHWTYPHLTLAPRLMGPDHLLSDMSEEFSLSRIEVTNVERSPNTPFFKKWTGSFQKDGEIKKFTTNLKLDEDGDYQVLCHRTATEWGEEIFEILDIIDGER